MTCQIPKSGTGAITHWFLRFPSRVSGSKYAKWQIKLPITLPFASTENSIIGPAHSVSSDTAIPQPDLGLPDLDSSAPNQSVLLQRL